MSITSRFLAIAALAFAAGCGARGDAAPVTDEARAPSAAPASGNVVEVRMITDDVGNYFEPAEITARPGDMIRFVLASGVHNVSFPSDQNANAAGLPEPGPFLQMVGQTHDVTVGMGPGEYRFQCDPHAVLGMVGKLTVR